MDDYQIFCPKCGEPRGFMQEFCRSCGSAQVVSEFEKALAEFTLAEYGIDDYSNPSRALEAQP